MKVLDTKTRSIIEVNDSYGARLIEQGRAIPVPTEKAAIKEEPAPKAEKRGRESAK